MLLIRSKSLSMMSFITVVAGSFVEHEPVVVLVYRIYDPSSNRALAEPSAHAHLKHTAHNQAILTLTYRSLRSNRRSIPII